MLRPTREDRAGSLIRRAGDIVDLAAAVLCLYILAVLAAEIGDLLGFVKTMREGW